VGIAEIHLVKLKKRIKNQNECKTTFIKTNLNENVTKRNVIMNEKCSYLFHLSLLLNTHK